MNNSAVPPTRTTECVRAQTGIWPTNNHVLPPINPNPTPYRRVTWIRTLLLPWVTREALTDVEGITLLRVTMTHAG